MAGLGPAIHVLFSYASSKEYADARHMARHDDGEA
jgi:hypothetical protein